MSTAFGSCSTGDGNEGYFDASSKRNARKGPSSQGAVWPSARKFKSRRKHGGTLKAETQGTPGAWTRFTFSSARTESGEPRCEPAGNCMANPDNCGIRASAERREIPLLLRYFCGRKPETVNEGDKTTKTRAG